MRVRGIGEVRAITMWQRWNLAGGEKISTPSTKAKIGSSKDAIRPA